MRLILVNGYSTIEMIVKLAIVNAASLPLCKSTFKNANRTILNKHMHKVKCETSCNASKSTINIVQYVLKKSVKFRVCNEWTLFCRAQHSIGQSRLSFGNLLNSVSWYPNYEIFIHEEDETNLCNSRWNSRSRENACMYQITAKQINSPSLSIKALTFPLVKF
jgi:hypothetical protein